MNDFSITGTAGELRWGYTSVATLSSWSLKQDSLTATVVSSDPFGVQQQPLTFRVHTPKGHVWDWRISTLQIADATLTASVAP